MQEITTMRELRAVVEGGVRYLNNFFDNGQIPCHPVASITFLPSDFQYFPTGMDKGIALGWLLLYSLDGREWTYDFNHVLEAALENDGHFFITDWKFNIVMVVEYYLIEEIVSLLTTFYDDITLVGGYKWKPAELGTVESYSVDEYFSEWGN